MATANIGQLLTLLPTVLNLISLAIQTTGASASVPKYLTILASLVGQGAKAYDELTHLTALISHELTHLTALISQMVAEKREPTEDEWSVWENRSNLAHQRIQEYDIDAEQPEA
jgi:hypothetical protein